MKNFYYILLLLFLLSACQSEKHITQWRTEKKVDTIMCYDSLQYDRWHFEYINDTIKIKDSIIITKFKLKYIMHYDTIIKNDSFKIVEKNSKYSNRKNSNIKYLYYIIFFMIIISLILKYGKNRRPN